MELISSVLFSLFKDTPQHDDWMVACLQGAWRGLLGEKLADVCRPVRLRDRELTVEVADPAWMATLSTMKAELLARLQGAAGSEIKGLAFIRKGLQ